VTFTQRQRVGLTVAAILLGIAVIVSGFVHRIQQPRIMTVSEMRANGLFSLIHLGIPVSLHSLTISVSPLQPRVLKVIGPCSFSASPIVRTCVLQRCPFSPR
jgi:hypothetical protein